MPDQPPTRERLTVNARDVQLGDLLFMDDEPCPDPVDHIEVLRRAVLIGVGSRLAVRVVDQEVTVLRQAAPVGAE